MTDEPRETTLPEFTPALPVSDAPAAPPRAPGRLTALCDRHGRLLRQFLQFGVVGTVGFLVDNAFVYTAHYVFGLGLILAGLLSFFVAATGNWFLNRIWTFKGASTGRLHNQWLRYLGTNAIGFVLNRGVYIALITTTAVCVAHPVLALAAGSVGGLGVNFVMSRRMVFR
jgi:putative flippase GtrA